MGAGKWLPTMPLPVAQVALVAESHGLSVDDEGWMFRWLRRSWALRQAAPRPDEMSDRAWTAASLSWQEIDVLRQSHEAAYSKRADANRKNATARWRKASCDSHPIRMPVASDSHSHSHAIRTEQEQHHEQEQQQEQVGDVVPQTETLPRVVTPSQDVTPPRAGAREQRGTWLTPFGEAWERATSGQFAYGRAGRALKPLVAREGPEAVFKAWCVYLRETPTEFLSFDRFGQTYGHWAGTVPEAVGRGLDPNRAAVERVRLKLAARQAGVSR